jgi:hypothetical protein
LREGPVAEEPLADASAILEREVAHAADLVPRLLALDWLRGFLIIPLP